MRKNYVLLQPAAHCHPLVKRLFARMKADQAQVVALANKVGVTHKALCHWRHGASPLLGNFEATANALGYLLGAQKLVHWQPKIAPNPSWRAPYSVPQMSKNPLVTFLFDRMAEQRVTIKDMARHVGLSERAMVRWHTGYQPRIDTLDAALRAVGYRISMRWEGEDDKDIAA